MIHIHCVAKRVYMTPRLIHYITGFIASAMNLGQVLLVMTDWYISQWSSQSFTVQRQWWNPVIYVALAIATIVIALVRALWFFGIMLDSSNNVFRRMLDAVLRAPISFFHTQPHGRVLNVRWYLNLQILPLILLEFAF